MATTVASSLANKLWVTAASIFQRQLGKELATKGLRWEDLFNKYEPDVAHALQYASEETLAARHRRVLRAVDLDLKKKNFQDYAPDQVLEPFKFELVEDMAKFNDKMTEKAVLDMHKRGLPSIIKGI